MRSAARPRCRPAAASVCDRSGSVPGSRIGLRTLKISAPATAKLTASAMNEASRPNSTVKPAPRAAPIASIAPHVDAMSAVASGRSRLSTRFGSAAFDAGAKNAAEQRDRPLRDEGHPHPAGTDEQEPERGDGLDRRREHEHLAPVEAVGDRARERRDEERREALRDEDHRRERSPSR